MKQDKKDLGGEESEIDLGEKGKLMKNDKQGWQTRNLSQAGFIF